MIDFFIPRALAADAGGGSPFAGFAGFDILIIVGFVLVFYFLIWRPQSKRTKDHRELVASIAKGDEIVTNGGIIGRVTKVDDQFLIVEVADNVELKLQRGAVASALPKGTIKSI